MLTQFEEYLQSQTHKNQEEIDHVVADYLGSFFPHMLYFESSFQNDLYRPQSIKPFLDHLGSLLTIQPPVSVGYRYFDSGEQLRFYLKFPDGIAWKNQMMWGNSLTFIACHGEPSGLQPAMGMISHNELCEIFTDYGKDSPSVLFMSSCNLFQDEEKARELLLASKCCGLFGYKGEIGYTIGAFLDMMFISTYYMMGMEKDPTQYLGDLYEMLLNSFSPAVDAGFSLFLP
jgi:hypothetical protein